MIESQGRFAQYFNEYAESLKAFGPDPAIIPGRGIGKRFKDDATQVRAGFECGIGLIGFSDYKEGDIIECFEIEKIRSSL